MSHYKPYPVYRDSGVEWIGQVPEHWRVTPLKVIAETVNGTTPESGKPEYWDGDIAWYTPTDIDNEVASELGVPRRYITQAGYESCAVKLSPPGSVILSTRAPIGSVGITTIPSTINQGCRTLIPAQDVPTSYLASTLVAAREELRLRGNGTTFQELSTEALRSLRVPMPPRSECVSIASGLDRETARFDALIAKKTRFIELLKEKRQALITHAVTKGLNPKAKMKASGVEWIGEVPEHWAVCKLSYRYSVELGKMLDEKRITGQHPIPYLRNKDVQWDSINTAELPVMDIAPNEHERYTVRNGDLLVCEGGDIGRSAVWRGSDNVIGYQKALHRLRSLSPDKDCVEFYVYVLGAAKRNGVFEEGEMKSTISHLPAEKFREYRFAFPPVDEQIEIMTSLKQTLGRIDLLTEKTQRSIDLLRERRAAFITAAVTGQIDLRESA